MGYIVTAVSIILLTARTSFTQGPEQGQRQVALHLKREIRKTVEVQYLLYVPPDYEKGDGKWPLLLFLHGMGERGNDLERVKIHGPANMISQGEDFPFVVVSPLCPRDQWWEVDALTVVLDAVIEQYRIDENRVYVTGLSMGGYGTWRLAYTNPGRFAAAVPICGGGDPEKVHLMANVPTWVFHGAKDKAVPLEMSQEMVDALKAAGGDVRFTVYPEAGHVEAWENAYGDPGLWEWLASQRRRD
ncbi:MAG: prolyl oligopeptidase family serine peptidase [Candidatus Neomarinimicrobiota bacterium]